MSPPKIEMVSDRTLPEFAEFLHDNLDRERSSRSWEADLRVNWDVDRPNYGFVMRAEGRIVGGIGAIYATRQIAKRDEKFCNITSWCVLEPFRKHSMRLAMAAIGQGDYHYTDFSPTPVVGGVLRFLKFQPIDDRQTVIMNILRPFAPGRVITQPGAIASNLSGDALLVYKDHAAFPWLRHLLVGDRDGRRWCHVIYKRRSFKGLPSSHVLHVSDPTLMSDHLAALCNHMLMRGMASIHIETRRLQRNILPSRIRSGFNAKLFLSPTLEAQQIDYLYSESVAMDL